MTFKKITIEHCMKNILRKLNFFFSQESAILIQKFTRDVCGNPFYWFNFRRFLYKSNISGLKKSESLIIDWNMSDDMGGSKIVKNVP